MLVGNAAPNMVLSSSCRRDTVWCVDTGSSSYFFAQDVSVPSITAASVRGRKDMDAPRFRDTIGSETQFGAVALTVDPTNGSLVWCFGLFHDDELFTRIGVIARSANTIGVSHDSFWAHRPSWN